MTTLTWILFGTTIGWMLIAIWVTSVAVRLATRLTRSEQLFKEQEREHIREIQELANQYPPPKGDIAP